VATAAVGGGFVQRAVAQDTSATAVRRVAAAEDAYQSADDQRKKALSLQTIVVTGTNLNAVTPASIPATLYTAEDLRNLGANDIQEFARLVPQNRAARTSQGLVNSTGPLGGANFGGHTAFDLGGLGPAATLTLLNGRRMTISSINGDAADASLLPL